jgi:hypothetical protein
MQLYKALAELVKENTSIAILNILETKLGKLLQVVNLSKYKVPKGANTPIQQRISSTMRDQNIIGWNNFLGGYTSNLWAALQRTASTQSSQKHKAPWATKLIQIIVMCSSTGGRLTPSVSDCTIEKCQSQPVRASLFSS